MASGATGRGVGHGASRLGCAWASQALCARPGTSAAEARSLPAARRIPVFLGVQAECLTCGKEITDPLTLEEWGRFCSARCHYRQGLPLLQRHAA